MNRREEETREERMAMRGGKGVELGRR